MRKYIEEQKKGGHNVDDPEYSQNQEIVQKINIFFNDLSDPLNILERKEAYLISCFTALDELHLKNSGGYEEKRSPHMHYNSVNLEFITKNLMKEFPTTLLNAIQVVIKELTSKSKAFIQ